MLLEWHHENARINTCNHFLYSMVRRCCFLNQTSWLKISNVEDLQSMVEDLQIFSKTLLILKHVFLFL